MLRIALTLSAALHGALGMWVEVRGGARPAHLREVVDSWVGPGIEVDAVPVAPAPPPGAAMDAPAAAAAPPAAEPTPPHVVKAPVQEATRPAEHVPSEPRTPHEPAPAERAPLTSAATAETAASASTASTTSTTSTPSFGAAGLPTGVRHLPKAFTRALGIASRGDPRWLTLPPGDVGEARIELAVDEDGRLGELTYSDREASQHLAPVVRHLLENTALLLANGRFSLDPSKLDAGLQRLRVRVEVTERTASSAPDGDPNELRELEYEPPSAGKPGRGSFALNSGRRVIGWVYLE